MNLEKKIQCLENALYAIEGKSENMDKKEVIFYSQIFPDHKDVIPKEDLWSENICETCRYSDDHIDYDDIFTHDMNTVPTFS